MFLKKKISYENASESELIRGCIKNKRFAQNEFYQRFSSEMYRVCLGYAKDECIAQELLQDSFIKVFSKLTKYEDKGSLEGWVRRIVINTCIDYVRKTNPKFVAIDLQEFYSFKRKYYTTNLIQGEYEKDYFLFLIQGLAVGYRTILNLYFIEEYKHADIAKELDISVGTSKSQLSRGKFLLRKTLEEELLKDEVVRYG